jgi:hypothetical protein
MGDSLQQGINAYKAGKRDEARRYFIAAIKQNQNNERAWQFMYNVANDDREKLSCLQQILRINPQNEKATTLLNQLKNSDSPLQTPINAPLTRNNYLFPALVIIGVFFAVCGIFLVIPYVGGKSSPAPAAPTLTLQEGAWYACTSFVEEQLTISTSKAERYTARGVSLAAADQYVVEVYYPKLGDVYRCKLLRNSNGDMELLSLKLK